MNKIYSRINNDQDFKIGKEKVTIKGVVGEGKEVTEVTTEVVEELKKDKSFTRLVKLGFLSIPEKKTKIEPKVITGK